MIVMSRIILAALPLAACTTAMDAMRDGQPVIATTIAALNDDPEAWDGKWVRLEGRVDQNTSWLLDARGDVMFLDPKIKLPPDEPDPADAVTRAVVSGQVDLACWKIMKAVNGPHFDDEGQAVMIHVMVPPDFRYCPGGRANLVNVLVSTSPESAP